MESLPLFKDKKEKKYFFLFLIFVFSINLYLLFIDYQKFTTNEVYKTDAIVLNSYQKSTYTILKLQTLNSDCDFTFFTSAYDKVRYKRFDIINLFIVSKNISFMEYLKGFYGKSFDITILKKDISLKNKIYNIINSQHTNQDISSLYSALFIATSINQNIRQLCANFGISHLVAISGFHLGVISFIIYWLIYLIYNPIHKNYFPYRNKRFDIFIGISIILFSYLVFIDFVPSLLRAFMMYLFGLFMLRNNIKLFSFEILLIILTSIIALFPKLLFSLSLWFSIAGVFYIFLFLQYFKNINRYIKILLFNFWIYFALNPIIHLFFEITTLEQLFSPILTLLFTIFYPIVIVLHLIGFGGFFDSLLLETLNFHIDVVLFKTPLWFFISYIFVSLFSISNKKVFILLNILSLLFTIYTIVLSINLI